MSNWDEFVRQQIADQAWLDTLAESLLQAATDGDPTDIVEAQQALASLAARNWPSASAVSALEQLRLLLVLANSAMSMARSQLVRIEPGSLRARILESIAREGGSAFNETVVARTEARQSHVSRACRELSEAGCLSRRAYGRRVEWSLTELGRRRVEACRILERSPQTANVEREAEQVRAAAQADASTIIASAESEAERIVAEARKTARSVTSSFGSSTSNELQDVKPQPAIDAEVLDDSGVTTSRKTGKGPIRLIGNKGGEIEVLAETEIWFGKKVGTDPTVGTKSRKGQRFGVEKSLGLKPSPTDGGT